jgi:hypothetical protein
MKHLFSLFLLIPMLLSAQISDDFSDGDFTNNPSWTGTAEKYIVNSSFQLQLNDTDAGSAWLSTPYSISGAVEWRFWIKLNFSPSGSNYSDVYLISDNPNLNEALNGYFLRFGEALANDPIELFKKQGTQLTSLARGTPGLVATAFEITVKVVRSAQGEWSIFADPTGSGLFDFEASATDNSFQPGGYFGFFSQYTVSNSNRMFYDNVYVGPEEIDTDPPQLLSGNATDPFTFELFFDEALNQQTVENISNYSVSDGIGNPTEAGYGDNAAMVRLQFQTAFELGEIYSLTINNLTDLSGNQMQETAIDFSYYEAQPTDVVINEIMADPTPVVGLPEWEYVELYNNTSLPISLDGWTLLIGTGERLIGQIEIAPNGFVILGHQDAQAELEPYGSYFGFSSFQLANSGASLRLLNKLGVEISSVSYTDAWYRDSDKKEGGWSLEQIDPSNPCGGTNNWLAATDSRGGTPGAINSVDAPNALPPKPDRIRVLTDNILQVWFDQQMDLISLGQTDSYTLNPGGASPTQAVTNPADPVFVELVFDQPFSTGIIYSLAFSESLLNCAGIAVAPDTQIPFGIPSPPLAEDIVINEILFNPYSNGTEWVEIYNRSDKIIDLEQVWLAAVRQTPPNPPDTTLRAITTTSLLMLPNTYTVLTTDISKVTDLYFSPAPELFVQMASFPSYPNAGGTVMLKSKAGPVLDVFTYAENMHHPLLNSVKGVSLERIHYNRPAADLTNWHSAAETVGFGTPGYQNSVYADLPVFDDEIIIEPEIFSPDGDGFDDLTSIGFKFDKAGYTLNIYVFSGSGQQVRHLVKSMLASQEGVVSWDGRGEDGSRLPVGIYVVFVELFDLDGQVRHYKKPVVITTR